MSLKWQSPTVAAKYLARFSAGRGSQRFDSRIMPVSELGKGPPMPKKNIVSNGKKKQMAAKLRKATGLKVGATFGG